jgi:hypothetical protein
VFELGPRLINCAARRKRRRAALRPHFEALEARLTPSTYFWTAKGDGMSWNDPNNWRHFISPMLSKAPGTPTPFSSVVFPSFASLPKGSPTTINFNFSYIGFPISTLEIDDSYTFEGTPVSITKLLTVPNSFTAAGGAPTATLLLTGLSLAPGVQINTAIGSTVQIASPADPTGLQLAIEGAVSKTGGGRLVIDTQRVTFPAPVSLLQTPVSIAGGTILLGASAGLTGLNFQIGSGASLSVADNAAVTVGTVTGNGLVDLEGARAASDTTSLTIYVPFPMVDTFGGLIEGIGTLGLTGHGTLNTAAIDLSAAGSLQVSSGTLNVNGLISAGTLQVATGSAFGGIGSWYFSGAVVFDSGSTFTVLLDGTTAGTQYTRLVAASTGPGVDLGFSTLSGATNFAYQAGDLFTIVAAPSIKNAFQNVVAGMVLLNGVPFQVTTASTSVTLTALQSVTSTQLSSSGSPTNPGSPVTFTATVSTRTTSVTTGSVSFMEGTTLLATVPLDSTGTATFTTTSLPVGNTAITAVYGGSGLNLGSTSGTVIQSVVPFSTETSLATAPNPSVFGQSVALTATVLAQGVPVTVGTVSFYRGSQYLGSAALDGSGTAILTLSSLPAGNVRIQAAYGGSTDNLSSVSLIATQTVLPAPTTTSLILTTRILKNGARQYILVARVDVTGNSGLVPTGTVVFRRHGKMLGRAALRGGVATISLGRRAPRPGTYVALFRGNTRFGASSSTTVVLA